MEDTRRGWIIGAIQLAFVIAVIALALFLTNALKADQSSPASGQLSETRDAAIEISIVTPERETYAPAMRLNGVVETQTRTQIAPQVGGRVVYVSPNFKPGAEVEQGEVLVRIDPADYQLAVEQAQANIDRAASDLALLEAEAAVAIEEWNELYPDRAITDLAARKPQIAASRSALASAQAAKKTSELALARTRLVAPADARVLASALNVGQIVAPNMAVGEIYALDSVEIHAPLSVAQVEILSPLVGREVVMTARGTNQAPLRGVVTRLDATLDPRTRLATAYIRPEQAAPLTVGDFIEVSINAEAVEDALLIPQSAFVGRDQIWVVENGTLQIRGLTRLGERGTQAIVRDFDYADGVVPVPPVEAKPGMRVVIRQDRGAATTAVGVQNAR